MRNLGRTCMAVVVLVVGGVVVNAIAPGAAQAAPGGVQTQSASALQASSETSGRYGLPPGFKSWAQLFTVQQVLDNVAQQIQDVAHAEPGSGLAGVKVDAAANEVSVYWHGPLPDAAGKILRAARRRGVTVRVMPAAYSRAHLDAEVELIREDVGTSGAQRIATISEQVDGSGIQVGLSDAVPGPLGLSGVVSGPRGKRLVHLQKALDAGGVTLVAAQPSIETSREADFAPFWGGSLITSGSAVCSGGFTANWPAVGKAYLITALHCGPVGTSWRSFEGAFIGTSEGSSPVQDEQFIHTTQVAGRVYDGPGVFQDGQFSKPVAGAAHTNIGDFVCVSGAESGAFCGIKTTGTIVDCAHFSVCADFYVAASTTGQLVAGQGDSGGPIFSLTNGGSADIARGIQSEIDHAVTCSNPLGGTRLCSSTIWFSDVVDAMAKFPGLQITTG